jgi:hypothetical protein
MNPNHFKNILNSSKEEDVQSFLKNNSKILLSTFANDWVVNECIPKFRFGNEFISDFVIVSGQSFSYDIILIELEPPTSKPFTKQGVYAKRLNQALAQINEWNSWIENNLDYFRNSLSKQMEHGYGINQLTGMDLKKRGREFISSKIIIGKRSMYSEEDNKNRATLYSQTSKKIEILPYDRLLEVSKKLTQIEKNA